MKNEKKSLMDKISKLATVDTVFKENGKQRIDTAVSVMQVYDLLSDSDDVEEIEDDNVKNPAHYNVGGIETIQVIQMLLTKEEYVGYLKGNVLKYRERAQFKGKADEDYAKAREYKKMLDEVENVAIEADWRGWKLLDIFDRDESALR